MEKALRILSVYCVILSSGFAVGDEAKDMDNTLLKLCQHIKQGIDDKIAGLEKTVNDKKAIVEDALPRISSLFKPQAAMAKSRISKEFSEAVQEYVTSYRGISKLPIGDYEKDQLKSALTDMSRTKINGLLSLARNEQNQHDNGSLKSALDRTTVWTKEKGTQQTELYSEFRPNQQCLIKDGRVFSCYRCEAKSKSGGASCDVYFALILNRIRSWGYQAPRIRTHLKNFLGTCAS